jgi:agmatine/peptidylarginine deiminase
MTKQDIENELKNFLGVTKIIWIPQGLYGKQRKIFCHNSSKTARFHLLDSRTILLLITLL